MCKYQLMVAMPGLNSCSRHVQRHGNNSLRRDIRAGKDFHDVCSERLVVTHHGDGLLRRLGLRQLIPNFGWQITQVVRNGMRRIQRFALSFAKISAVHGMSDLGRNRHWPSIKILAMIPLLRHFVGWLVGAFRAREELVLENLALRQQLLALYAKRPRPRLSSLDKLFWIALRSAWSGWKRSLVLVTPETVVRWHHAGFRLYWAWLSRTRRTAGRKPLSREVRDLIFRMVAENPTWGAPRIHGELLKLGFDISERTVSRWIKR